MSGLHFNSVRLLDVGSYWQEANFGAYFYVVFVLFGGFFRKSQVYKIKDGFIVLLKYNH